MPSKANVLPVTWSPTTLNGAPSFEANTSTVSTPDPPVSSVASMVTSTGLPADDGTDGAAVGAAASMITVSTLVSIGGFTSNTIVAWPTTAVPVGEAGTARTTYVTKPRPSGAVTSGGRNPFVGSAGTSPVMGSIPVSVQV